MNREILSELSFFLISAASGAALIVVYDILRVFRRLLKHSAFWIGAEDLLYWTGAGIFLFLMMERYNYGIVRGFSFAGALLGMLIWQTVFSNPAVWLMEMILRFLLRVIAGVLSAVLFPVRVIGMGAEGLGRAVAKCLKKFRKIFKNTLKKPKKTDKINLDQNNGAATDNIGQRIESKRHESHTGKKKTKKKSRA